MAKNQYHPNYAVPPGWLLEERLGEHGTSHSEFALRCGMEGGKVEGIISGKVPIDPETALQFEKALGVDASIWIKLEEEYRMRCEGG